MATQSSGGKARAAALSPQRRAEIARDAAIIRWRGAPASPLRALVRKIEKHKAAIAIHRDALRDILDDLENVTESVTEGHHTLECAIDKLSEYL